jgi:Xaa-Pro dipeptidase
MDDMTTSVNESDRLLALTVAEDKALALLDAIEAAGLIVPDRTERELDKEIYALAERDFGVETHWHKRIVRAGINTLCDFSDNPPIRTIEEDDIVFLDVGPVFENWEADVGRSYAIGNDPAKHALVRELPIQFDKVKAHFEANPAITGADLYAFACQSAEEAGWRFSGKIAGHIVAEFPHARLPGVKQHHHISPANPYRMCNLDGNGQVRHWILEIHLAAPDGAFGGFYERLLQRAVNVS